ncbi:MAG: cytochrome c3 family protein [Planctomycetota bacterium]
MRAFLALLVCLAAARAQEPASSCVTHCHGAEQVAHKASVHAGTLACTDCHGGDPSAQRDKEKSHDPAKGFVGKPPRANVPALCGDCHADPARMHAFGLATDPLVQYRASIHGQRLFGKGDENVAVCTDCHGVHGILPAQDPRAPTARENQPATCGRCHADAAKMTPYGVPADVVARFEKSVHGRALLVERSRGAPACADCHGSHGAVPPGVRDLVQVCGQCHEHTAEQYRKSPHFGAKDMRCAACHEEEAKKDPLAYAGQECTACHGTHDIGTADRGMLEGDAVGHCGHCHRKDETAKAAAQSIVEGTRRLEHAMARTRDELRAAKRKGLFIDHEELYLRESERALVFARPLAHSLDLAAISKHLEDGLKRQDRTLETLGKEGKKLRDRRILLSGLAGILLLLAALAALKLQELRRLS